MTTRLRPGDTFTVKINAYPYTHGSFITRNVAEDGPVIFGQHFYTDKDGNALITFKILIAQRQGDYTLDIGMGENGSNPFGISQEQMQSGIFWPISSGDNSYSGNKIANFTIISSPTKDIVTTTQIKPNVTSTQIITKTTQQTTQLTTNVPLRVMSIIPPAFYRTRLPTTF